MESLFTKVAKELRKEKEAAIAGKKEISVTLLCKEWRSYNDDDLAHLVISAAEYSVGADENSIIIEYNYLSDYTEIHGKDEIVSITIHVAM